MTASNIGMEAGLTDAAISSPDTWTDGEKAGALLGGQALTLAYAAIQSSGIAELVQDLTCKPRGRKQRGLTTVDVLAACIALSLNGRAPQFRAIAELLHEMPEVERIARGITRPWPTASTSQADARRMKRAAEEAVRRRFEALVQALDPYEGPRNHRMEVGSLIGVAQKHAAADDGTMAAKRAQLIRLMNSLVQGTVDLVPSDLLGQMGSAFAIDGTFTPTWATGPKGHRPFTAALAAATGLQESSAVEEGAADAILRGMKRTADAVISADPEAGWYIRQEADGNTETKGFGYEAHLAVVTDSDGQTGSTSFPSLVVGLSIDTPGFRPGPNAIEIAKSVKTWGASRSIDFRIGVFDALYPLLDIHDFKRPLRELGVMPIHRLRQDQLGASGVSHEGASLIEGTWYCAQMPTHLVNANKDRAADKIDDAQQAKRLAGREVYRMYRVSGDDVLDKNGHPKDHRYECPSSRRSGRQVTCARDESGVPRTDDKTGLPLPPLGIKALPLLEDGKTHAPAACGQRTFQIPASLSIQGREQAHPYMSAEWRATNNRFRSTNEGKNGSVKDPTAERIGTKGVRRVNGMAANGILLACQIAASNLRATKNFLVAAEVGEDGRLIRRYPQRGKRPLTPPRKPRTSAQRPTEAARPPAARPQRRLSARTRV
ncbi:MAG: hypothetical protein JWP40_3743 [Blastococcus sp.]|nr:hypothetical protein [Blastococcus sp.]